MRLVFEPFINDKGLIRIMKEISKHPEISPVLDSILIEQDFTLRYLKLVNTLHPGIDLFVNSFIQDSTVLKLDNIPVFVVAYDYDNKYETGGRYLSLNRTLVNNSYKDVQVVGNNDIFEEPDVGVIHDLIVELIILWKETHMGEITDAISKALKELDSVRPEESNSVEDTTDKIKEAMRNIGMKVDDTVESIAEEPKQELPKTEVHAVKEPVEQDLQEEDTPEICCKILDGKMAIMIPKGTKLDSRKVGDLEFDVLTFDMPDVNCNTLQLLKTVTQDSETKKPTETKKPIVKKVDKKEVEDKPIQTDTNESPKSGSVVSDLKDQKKEIDRLIKEARKSGDTDKVNELRKQRRKIRAKMNKIGAE